MSSETSREHYQPFRSFADWRGLALGDAWDEYLTALNGAREAAEEAAIQAAINIALRSAALETGAIEGLYATNRGITRAVALQGALWEAELDKLGPDVRGHFDAQLTAFDLVLDAATRRLPISEAWIRSLHAQVCASQESYKVQTPSGWQGRSLPHGEYKDAPNNVTLADGTTHWYAPVQEVPPEMHRLVDQLASPDFTSAHPVIQAAYAHHALTAVHPFADGNGRVARALASVFLYRDVGTPLVIFSDQQEPYWDALAAADNGQPQPFVTFVEDRALDTMALVTSRILRAGRPLDRGIAEIQGLLASHGGLTHAEVHAIGTRLTDLVQQAIETVLQGMSMPPDIQRSVQGMGGGHLDCTFWDQPYRTLARGGAFKYIFEMQEPAPARAEITPFVGIANDTGNRFTFIVIDANRQQTKFLRLRISDLHPATTAAAEALIEDWAYLALQPVLEELQRGVSHSLRSLGY
ncbi:MAG TPA: Fic family protein [Actinomycetota bacterium]|jgi:Fic family protein|nr:Fic family protein [Actinomycetota bacterium]